MPLASAGFATSLPMSVAMRAILATIWALLSASSVREMRMQSSNPTRTLPPSPMATGASE